MPSGATYNIVAQDGLVMFKMTNNVEGNSIWNKMTPSEARNIAMSLLRQAEYADGLAMSVDMFGKVSYTVR